jgi:hypothetical protein
MERATPMQFILERIMQKRKVEMRALGENGGGGGSDTPASGG